MTSREGKSSPSYASRFRNVAFLLIATSLFCALGSALLDSASTRFRLSDVARERSRARVSTNGSLSSRSSLPTKTPVDVDALASFLSAARKDRDTRLTRMAKEWLGNASDFDYSSKKRVVLKGLARWDVDESTARPFFSNPEDERVWREAARYAQEEERSATESASFFADLGSDADVDAALTFLDELGDVSSPNGTSETILWFDDAVAGDPVDSAGYVAAGDFESSRVFALSAQLCGAATRVFYFSTLGVLLLGILPVTLPQRVLQWTKSFGLAAPRLTRRFSSAFRFALRFDVLFRLANLSTVRLLN
ncbi:MAG: hypothetical protein ACI4NP_03670 [Thermoguttaceae bacterium]